MMLELWEEIPVPWSGGRSVRRCDPGHPLDFFRGRDSEGKYVFILDEIDDQPPRAPSIAGLDIDYNLRPVNRCEMVLTLNDNEQSALFGALCRDLLDASTHLEVKANSAGAAIVVGRIRRWQELLGRRKLRRLSRQKILGLVGELQFLEEVVLEHMDAEATARAWRGPYGDEQDFAIGGTIVEVKAQLSSADQALKISSEAQLDTSSGDVLLVHQTFSSTEKGDPGARTLNEFVDAVRATFERQSAVAAEVFEGGLLAVGYEPHKEYDEEAWLPVRTRRFEVTDTFPRLTPQNIASGIRRVRYEISIESCSEFERTEEWMKGKLFNVRT